jgi:hypothetical protein
MRLWSLHPKYLDAPGIVALWREGLLAQAVLRGQTKGYTRHPQLDRFRASGTPVANVASYLFVVFEEATWRGYHFDGSKVAHKRRHAAIPVTTGQLDYEWQHLVAKLKVRDPEWLAALPAAKRPEAHPLFRVVPGSVEGWEIGAARHGH